MAATAAEVPFHHVVLKEGCVSSVVVGHIHCRMVAAVRWNADQAIPCFSRAVEQFPDYRIKTKLADFQASSVLDVDSYDCSFEPAGSTSCACKPAKLLVWSILSLQLRGDMRRRVSLTRMWNNGG